MTKETNDVIQIDLSKMSTLQIQRMPEYKRWINMLRSCYDITHPNNAAHIEKNIKVKDEIMKFTDFLAAAGPMPGNEKKYPTIKKIVVYPNFKDIK